MPTLMTPDDDCAGEVDDNPEVSEWVVDPYEYSYEFEARRLKEQVDRLHNERAGLMQQITILVDENRALTQAHSTLIAALRRAEIMRDALIDRIVVDEANAEEAYS